MKKILLLLAILIPTLANARQLTPQQALARVQNTRGHRAPSLKKVVLAYAPQQSDSTLLYVLNQSNGEGFYILSADDLAPALLAYSDEGTFDADNMPDNVRWWISQYEASIARAIETQTDMNKTVTHSTQSTDGYLIKSKWDQGDPYYLDCYIGDMYRSTGCVATAMAQIMRYHQWPAQGVGSHTYTFTDMDDAKTEYTVSSNFAEHTYRWDQMADSYFTGTTAEQDQAVALLMKDCGVSVEMNYWNNGASGAANTAVGYALYTYFDYDKGLRSMLRSDMTDQEWEDMLVDELMAGRPVLYAGTSYVQGGHAFVCDGYDGNGMFHFNWGWTGGISNGYYLVTGEGALNPYTMNDTWAFNISQMAVIGIQPNKGSTETQPLRLQLSNSYSLSSSSVYRSSCFYLSGFITNIGFEPGNVTLGAVFSDGEHDFFAPAFYSTPDFAIGMSISPMLIYPSQVPYNKEYEVRPAFIDNNHPERGWQYVILPEGCEIQKMTVLGSEPTMILTSQPYFTSEGKHYDGNIVKKDDMTVHLEYEAVTGSYYGSYLYPVLTRVGETEATGYFDMDAVPLTQGDRGTVDLDISKFYLNSGKSLTPGKYKMQVYIDGATYKKIAPYDYFITYLTVVDELPSNLLGDLNHDGEVNVTDVTMLVNMILTNSGNSDGDIDGSGQIDVADVTRLVNIILGK